MASGKLTLLKTRANRNIYRFDLPKPNGSGTFTEYRGRIFIVRGDGSQLETPHIEYFTSEDAAREWLEAK